MRKRTIALLVLLAALAGAAVSQAYLFTVGQGTAENVITYGSLTMELSETDGNSQPVSMDGDAILRLNEMPIQEVTRKITVTNTCQEEMYLRMRLSIGGTSAGGEPFTLSVGTDGEVECAANASGGWQAGSDGWYYYSAYLAPGSTTNPLLEGDQLKFHTNTILLTHPNEKLSLSVEVQAVQRKNNGPDAQSAQGWPEEVA